MERVRRRFWTWAVTVFAALVIFAAAVSGVFQLAVLSVPSYRDDLAAWVSRTAQRPVEIGGIGLVWRGIYPRLDLHDITLYDDEDQPALTADRISLGFSLLRLLAGEAIPNRLELAGISLTVEVDADNRVTVAGFETFGDEESPNRDRLMRELRRFERLRLSGVQILLSHPSLGADPVAATLSRGEVERTRSGFDAEAQLQLPPAYGEAATFSASIEGDITRLDSWHGDFEIGATRLALQPWLRRWMAPGAQLQASDLALYAEGELAQGRLLQLGAELKTATLIAAQRGRVRSAQDVRLKTTLAPEAGGWRLQVDRLEADDQPLLQGGLRYQRGAEGQYGLDADIDSLQLAPIAPWLSYLRASSALTAQAAGLGGELRALVLRLRRGSDRTRYSLRADLHELSLQPQADGRVGFRHLNARLSATEGGGRLQLSGAPLELQLPKTLAQALPFESVGGELQWARSTEGWTLNAPRFEWQLLQTRGSGDLRLDLPAQKGASPRIDLAASFSAEDVVALKPYMPLQWDQHLREWLDRAVVAGRVPRATLALRGPLSDFPYQERQTGEWKLELDAAGGKLAFAPDWPSVDNLSARLLFHGNGLEISSDSASISGNRVDHARARIADFRERLLVIDAAASGETARFYDFLRKSPLQKQLGGLTDHTRASGPARVAVQLDVPLRKVNDTAVTGTVALDGVQLFYDALDQPFDDLRGSLSFDNRGVRAERLDARFAELKVAARIEPREGMAGVVIADFPFSPQAAGSVAAFIPGFVRERLSGESQWHAELPLGATATALALSSDLRGSTLQLPPPLGKTAEQVTPIRLTLGADAASPLRVRLNYLQRLGADIAFARDGQKLQPRAMHLRLGAPAPAAEGRGTVLSGQIAEIDLGQWIEVLQQDGDAAAAAPDAPSPLALRQADVTAGRWLFDDQIIDAARARWTQTPEGWRAELEGDGAVGELRYARGNGGIVTAALQHLNLRMKPTPPNPAGASAATQPAGSSADPVRWPILDLRCDKLVADGVELGRATLRSSRIPDGQKIEALTMEGGKLTLNASGAWRRAQSRSTAELKFDLSSSDVGAVLKAFGYTPTLVARESHFSGELAWPSSSRINWEQASGRVVLKVEDGTLKAVEPGAGRVLGLLNLYAIPRRLLLDFKDVFAAGLSFDKLDGSFTVGEGVARTDDLQIEAPSLRMEMRGRIGLAARDFDQTVKVYPDVASGVTLGVGAALLGGPAVGALVLLAQQVLDRPIEQATQLSYRITGSWDNPRVERVPGT